MHGNYHLRLDDVGMRAEFGDRLLILGLGFRVCYSTIIPKV